MSSQMWLFYYIPSFLKDNIRGKLLLFTYIKGSSYSYIKIAQSPVYGAQLMKIANRLYANRYIPLVLWQYAQIRLDYKALKIVHCTLNFCMSWTCAITNFKGWALLSMQLFLSESNHNREHKPQIFCFLPVHINTMENRRILVKEVEVLNSSHGCSGR